MFSLRMWRSTRLPVEGLSQLGAGIDFKGRASPAVASLRVPLRSAKGTDIPLRLASLAASPFAERKGRGWLEFVAVFVVGEA